MQIQSQFGAGFNPMQAMGGQGFNPRMLMMVLQALLSQLTAQMGGGGGQVGCGCGGGGPMGNSQGMANALLGGGQGGFASGGGAFAGAGASGSFAGAGSGGSFGGGNPSGPLPFQGAQSLGSLPNGGLQFRAGMNIDTDGSGSSHGDRCHQNQTSLRTAGGGSLNADTCPYMVLPPQLAKQYGIKPGDLALVKYNGRVSPAIFGDVGPRNKLGEGSTRLAANLGINTDPNRGGVGGGVEYQVFPGSGRGVQWNAQNTTTDALMQRIQGLQH